MGNEQTRQPARSLAIGTASTPRPPRANEVEVPATLGAPRRTLPSAAPAAALAPVPQSAPAAPVVDATPTVVDAVDFRLDLSTPPVAEQFSYPTALVERPLREPVRPAAPPAQQAAPVAE